MGVADYKNLRSGMSAILTFTLVLLIVLNIPLGFAQSFSNDGKIGIDEHSRNIRDLPPPDPKGERWGDWIISCLPGQTYNATFQNIKLHGNITVMSGCKLKVDMSSKIIQLTSATEHYYFDVKENAQLQLLNNSLVQTNDFFARADSTVIMDSSSLYANGDFSIDSEILVLTDSHIENRGSNGSAGSAGSNSQIVFKAGTTTISNSTIISTGGSGSDGDGLNAGATGGSASVIVELTLGQISNTVFNISGGNGGLSTGNKNLTGFSGGSGGHASLSIKTSTMTSLTISKSKLNLNGGNGGKGSLGQSGGINGGLGGTGGTANLSIKSKGIIIENSQISAVGGAAGKGGSGGLSTNFKGGTGGEGGRGGKAQIRFDSDAQFYISNSDVSAKSASGGEGGFYGYGSSENGNAGKGGDGGFSSIDIKAGRNYLSSNSSLMSYAGMGGLGGLGFLIGGDGGDGGDAFFNVTSPQPLVQNGTSYKQSAFGSAGGDGGDGGEHDTSSGSGGMHGRGGSGGASFSTLNSQYSMDVTNTYIHATKSRPGSGSKNGIVGYSQLMMRTVLLNISDSYSDWTIEGFDNNDKGVIINTCFEFPLYPYPRVFIAPEQTSAKVEFWNNLNVGIPESEPTDKWEISVYLGHAQDNTLVASASIIGPTVYPTFLLKSETVDSQGSKLMNYTIIGRLIGTNVYTEAKRVLAVYPTCDFIPTTISLKILCYTCQPPTVEIDVPTNNATIQETALSPCRAPNQDEINAGIPAPKCLRILGSAQSAEKDNAVIDDIKLWLVNDQQGTFYYRPTSIPSVHMNSSGARSTEWYFDWEVGAWDFNKGRFNWSEGKWQIMVSVHSKDYTKPDDPGLWSETVSINITLKHLGPPVPKTIKTDAGLPEIHEIKANANGINVTFIDAKVHFISSLKVRVIRMEWDFNNDGTVDWASSTNCSSPSDCAVPPASFVYSKPGTYDAVICAEDNLGYRSCDIKKVEVTKAEEPAIFGMPRTVLIALAVAIVAISAIIISALVITSLSEATKYSIMSFILVPLYSRLKKEEMLDNYTRGEIRGYIVANPGAHYSRIKRDLNLNNGTLIYHLTQLEREGFIYSHRDDYYRRFYPRGRKPRPGANLTTVQESIIETLLDNPGLSADELAEKLDKSRKVTNYHLVWLRRWGLIEAKDDGRRKTYTVLYEDETEKKEDLAKDAPAEDDTDGPSEPSGP